MSTSFKKLMMSVGLAACCGCLLAATGCSHPDQQAQTDSAAAAIVKDPSSDPHLSPQQKAQIQQYMVRQQAASNGATASK